MNNPSVSASPHLRGSASTGKIMLCVLLALLPAAITGCFNFGRHAVLVLTAAVGSAMLFEFFFQVIMRRRQTAHDLSAAVTGLLLGMSLPPDLPLGQVILGSFAAVILVKQFFGGIGRNFANPAAAAVIFLTALFHSDMTAIRFPQETIVFSATTLIPPNTSYWDLILGSTAGNIGQVCAAALLLGGLFLCFTRIISPVTPAAYLGSLALLSLIGGENVAEQLLGGGVMLGAFFFACDYTTTPLTRSGKALFGLGCGVLTFFIRKLGGYPDGTVYAVVTMNLLTPLIDRFTMQKPFGAVAPEPKKRKQEKAQEVTV